MAATTPSHDRRADLRRDGSLGDAVDAVEQAVEQAVGAAVDTVEHAVDTVGQAVAELKPRLRGWFHAGTAPAALLVGTVLVALAPTPRARLAAAVFTVTSFGLFATSALFHRGRWSPKAHDVLRRLDHANIFLVIAGTYTPFALLLLTGTKGATLLLIAWVGAVAGVLFRTFWLSAPRWLYVPVYVAMGWVSVFFLQDMYEAGGPAVITLLGAGGLLHTLGAVVYGTRWPDPFPRWFGFHEIFHVLTVLAFAAHCWAVALIVLRG